MLSHSYYSLRYGTVSPSELVEKAHVLGIQTLALTDIHRVSGVYDFVQACEKWGVKPVVGMEFRTGDELKYNCLARNPAGFSKINAFATQYLSQNLPWPDRPDLGDDVWVIYSFNQRKKIQKLGIYERIGVQAKDKKQLWQEKDLSRFVWAQPVTFLDKKGFSMHRLLRAIDKNTLLSKKSSSFNLFLRWMLVSGTHIPRSTFRSSTIIRLELNQNT